MDGTDIESEPFEDPVETETHESTPPTLVPILRRTAHMAVRVPPTMSPGLFVSMAGVEAMSESAFRKTFRSSYESSQSSSPPDLPSRKCYRGTSELVEDDEEEEEDDKEDEEIEESLDFDSMSKDAEDEGPTTKDEDPTTGDEGLAVGDEGPDMGVESHSSDDESRGLNYEGHSIESDGLSLGDEEEAILDGQQRAVLVMGAAVYNTFEVGQGSGSALESERPERVSESRQPTLTTWTDPEDGMVYIDVPAYPPPAPPVQTPPLPEWSSGLLPISPAPSIVPSHISSPMMLLTVPSPIATPVTAETKGFLTESGAVRDEIFSQRYRFRSLEHEQERVAVTFGALWRPVLALESWAGQTDAHRAALWHAIRDTQWREPGVAITAH
ncbi:hypothetical protein Tco_1526385 [Tanacetum coccineum]